MALHIAAGRIVHCGMLVGVNGGVGAGSLTTTVTPCAIVTSGLVSTVAPSIEDKLTNDSVACASALATRAEVFDDVLTISSCKYTLAAVTCSVVWHSGG